MAVVVDEATDASLVSRSLDEPELFGKLFDRHTARINRYAARRGGQSLADDVMAETFLRAFRQRGKYDPSRPDALPWLYGIATNLIRKQRDAEMRIYRLVVKIGITMKSSPTRRMLTPGSVPPPHNQFWPARSRRCLAAIVTYCC